LGTSSNKDVEKTPAGAQPRQDRPAADLPESPPEEIPLHDLPPMFRYDGSEAGRSSGGWSGEEVQRVGALPGATLEEGTDLTGLVDATPSGKALSLLPSLLRTGLGHRGATSNRPEPRGYADPSVDAGSGLRARHGSSS